MKFLVDEPLPPALCKWLIKRGHEAEHVLRIKLGGRPDALVVARAVATGSTIITKDDDYASVTDRFRGAQVIWLRVGNLSNRALLSRMEAAWPEIELSLTAGKPLIEISRPDDAP
jgi:predicted nuclease of predicted toxin-antitoxin system